MVRKGGLEPPWVSPPDPKSGASANSATFATHSKSIISKRNAVLPIDSVACHSHALVSQ